MKIYISIISAILLIGQIAFAQDFEEIKGRTWTSGSGKKIDAELISYEKGTVTLKSLEGKMFRIPLTALIPSDQAFIKQSQPTQAAAPAASAPPAKETDGGVAVEAANNKLLPTLSNGNWTRVWAGRKRLDNPRANSKSHSVYKHAKFEARIDDRGSLYIIPIKDGVPMEHQLRIAHTVGSFLEDKDGERIDRWKRNALNHKELSDEFRTLEYFTDFPPPSANPSTVTLKGLYEDDIPWECTYIFKDNTVTYWGSIVSRSELPTPAAYWMSCVLSPSHVFGPKVTIDEQRKQTSHCSLSVIGHEKADREYDYSSSQNIHHPFKSAVVSGHFQPYRITFEALDKDFPPVYRCYAGVPIFNGSSVWSIQGYDESSSRFKRRDRTPKVKITID